MRGYEVDEGILDTRVAKYNAAERMQVSDRNIAPAVMKSEVVYAVMDILQKLTNNEED